ncbi:MAG: GFA family protein [Myxococcota bacterium]
MTGRARGNLKDEVAMVSGSCLCGDVAWEIDGPLDAMTHCHCTSCRKAHGTAYATFVTFPEGRLRWLRGDAGIRGYESSPGSVRNFCGRCGSKLPSVAPFPFPYAFAGPLEGDLGLAPSSHIFVASKAPWHTISDDLPRHDGLATPGEEMPTPRHTEAAPGKIRGGCLCGAVAFEVEGPLVGGAIVSCHCLRCRRARSAAHGSHLFVDAALFSWLRGEDQLEVYKVPEAARYAQTFCRVCGSAMPAKKAPPPGPSAFRVIPCGALDDDPGVREGLHIFAGSRAPWETIVGSLPQHAEYPPAGFPPLARAAVAAVATDAAS